MIGLSGKRETSGFVGMMWKLVFGKQCACFQSNIAVKMLSALLNYCGQANLILIFCLVNHRPTLLPLKVVIDTQFVYFLPVESEAYAALEDWCGLVIGKEFSTLSDQCSCANAE